MQRIMIAGANRGIGLEVVRQYLGMSRLLLASSVSLIALPLMIMGFSTSGMGRPSPGESILE